MNVSLCKTLSSVLLTIMTAYALTTSLCHASNDTLVFPDACEPGPEIVIAAIGDLLMHKPLQQKAAERNYTSLWEAAMPYLKQADLSYANLEGPIARGVNRAGRVIANNDYFDHEIYTDYPLFNYHPKLAKELRADGIDIVSTANNHALDRQGIGVNKTIRELNGAGVAYTGTRASDTSFPFISVTEKKDFKIAWIACTEHTNGIEDVHDQVLYCYKSKHKRWIIDTIHALKDKVDAVIVTPHWGEEYEQRQNNSQVNFAHAVLDAGAKIVIGSHPHVLQPMEKYVTKDGRNTFIIYSMGNFVSGQASPVKRATIILLIGLTKTKLGTIINGIRFVPMFMQNNAGIAKLQLDQINSQSKYTTPRTIISNLLPMGNALYSLPIVTNPQCR